MKLKHAFLFLILFACSDNDQEQTILLNSLEATLLEKLATISQSAESYFDGYDYMTTHPIYVIVKTDLNDAWHGYFINPSKAHTGSVKLTDAQSYGMSIHRNDAFVEAALTELGGGLFRFYATIDQEEYFLAQYEQGSWTHPYLQYKDRDSNLLPGLIVHEVLHIYQLNNWNYQLEQNLPEYPLTQETLELHLLLHDLMKDAYFIPESQYDEYLRYYVAIWSELIRIDPSDRRYTETMGIVQELTEGSARYIEHFALAESFFPGINDDPTHGWAAFVENPSSKLELRQALIWRGFYHQGAIATRMLKKAGLPIETEFARGQTPYHVAKSHLALSENELKSTLATAKSLVNWGDYVDHATRLLALPD